MLNSDNRNDKEILDTNSTNQVEISAEEPKDNTVDANAEEVVIDDNNNVNDEVKVLDASAKKDTVQPIKNGKKSKKGNGKISGAFGELKRVTWPTFGKVVKNTIVVLSVTAIMLLVVFGIDRLLYVLYNALVSNY